MSAVLPMPVDVAAAEAFLASFPASARRRGLGFLGGTMSVKYSSVDAGATFDVEMELPEAAKMRLYYRSGKWDAICSCPTPGKCRHAYAAFFHLLKQFSSTAASAPAAAEPKTRTRKSRVGTAGAATPVPAYPPGSIAAVLSAAVERKLVPVELEYCAKISEIYERCRRMQGITAWELTQLRMPIATFGWERLNLWPVFPETEHLFWLYIVNGASERGLKIPDFMVPVSDLTPLVARIAKWKRTVEIARWKKTLQRVAEADSGVVPSAVPPTDLRVVIDETLSLLEWKRPGREAFEVVKPAGLKQLEIQHDSDGVSLTTEGALIWQAIPPGLFHFQAGTLPHHSPEARRIVANWLAHPALGERIVTVDRVPFQRSTEMLRWVVDAPESEDGDYRLRLQTPDGRPISGVRLVVPGSPHRYITRDTIYPGPSIDENVLEASRENVIPAEAVETRQGVTVLRRLGVDLPPRLQERIRTVAVRLHLRCSIVPSASAYSTEYCHVQVSCESEDGRVAEIWGGYGWAPLRGTSRGAAGPENELIYYDRSQVPAVPTLLEGLGVRWDGMSERWITRITRKFPEAFATWLRSLPPEVVLELKGELASLAQGPVAGTVRLEAAEVEVDWFDLRVVLDVSDVELSPEELKLLLNAKGGWVRLGRKGWRRLAFNLSPEEDERLANLGLNPHELTAEPQRLHALQLADAAAKKFLPEPQVEAIRRRADEIKTRVNPPVPAAIQAQLRPYQLEGFHFLAYLSANRFGGILADDMGLGKTLQTLAWLVWLREQSADDPKPSLVVCPKSVMDNWRAEVARFVPGLRVRVWSASELPSLANEVTQAELHVINYNQLRLSGEALAGTLFQVVILDEGQYIKNPSSITAQVARGLRTENRLVLTGTPIENRLLDLWSLMSFAMPGALGSRTVFARQFDQKEDTLARRRLGARVRPFLLRRTKRQVARDLPDRIEEDLYCEIEGEQKLLYRAELKRAQSMLLKVQTQAQLNQDRFNFLTSLLRLRQICCDPRLVNPESKAPSAKVEALVEQLEPLIEEGQKVLVFSQFVSMLELLRTEMQGREWPFFYLAGDTENRGDLVRDFQNAPGAAVFLISLKAGGFGLNLTAASYVVLFDPWWNPAVEAQAIDRTHRIGQSSTVIAYRLLIKDSIEEKIRSLQKQKSALAEDILGEERFSQGLSIQDFQYLFSD